MYSSVDNTSVISNSRTTALGEKSHTADPSHPPDPTSKSTVAVDHSFGCFGFPSPEVTFSRPRRSHSMTPTTVIPANRTEDPRWSNTMTDPKSMDSSSKSSRNNDHQGTPGTDREFEVILKSGGVYCFAQKPTRASDDTGRPSAHVKGTKSAIPSEEGEGRVEEEQDGCRASHVQRSRWFRWVPDLTSLSFLGL